jgi:hypothetical protein
MATMGPAARWPGFVKAGGEHLAPSLASRQRLRERQVLPRRNETTGGSGPAEADGFEERMAGLGLGGEVLEAGLALAARAVGIRPAEAAAAVGPALAVGAVRPAAGAGEAGLALRAFPGTGDGNHALPHRVADLALAAGAAGAAAAIRSRPEPSAPSVQRL